MRSQEEALEGNRRLVAENQTKFGQLQATSNATINGLMAVLKATEEALVRERERMSHDTEVLRSQVVETEVERLTAEMEVAKDDSRDSERR